MMGSCRPAATLDRFRRVALWAVVAALGAACASPAPDAIAYDVDACDHCRMAIAQPAFAAQLVTTTGKNYRFDDPGCLAAFVTQQRVAPGDIHSIWTNDHAHPDRRLRVEEAVFVVSERIRAPMNGHAAAFASREDAAAFQSVVGGQLETWAGLLKRPAS